MHFVKPRAMAKIKNKNIVTKLIVTKKIPCLKNIKLIHVKAEKEEKLDQRTKVKIRSKKQMVYLNSLMVILVLYIKGLNSMSKADIIIMRGKGLRCKFSM